jgi:L-asparaginase II
MQAADFVPLVELTRGDTVESIHYGAFVVVNSRGEVLHSEGNPGLITFPRSSMKPFQALPFIEAGGDVHFDFRLEEVAIMCASHSGTEQHTSVLERMHHKIGTSESDLACGIHWPSDKSTRMALRLAGLEPNQFHHNCSGKHTGMLAYAKLLGAEIKNYLDIEHPVQVSIRKTLAEMTDLEPSELAPGIDGCSAPVYPYPLRNMALAVARLVDPKDLEPKRASACRKISNAMIANPVLIAGPGKFDTDLITFAQGKVISKAGAEGYQVIGVMPKVTDSDSPGIGIAIKVSDGDLSGRARAFISLQILMALGVIAPVDMAHFEKYGVTCVKNWRNTTVGEIRTTIKLDKTK